MVSETSFEKIILFHNFIKMKIGKRETAVLTDAVIKKVYDSKAIEEVLIKEAETSWEKFKKSKEWKDILKCFEIEGISSMYVNTKKLFGLEKSTCSSWMWTLYREELENWILYKRAYRESNRSRFPYEADLRREIELQLTIEALWWDDIHLILNKIIDSLKAKYKF